MARRKDQARRARTREAVQAYRERRREAGEIEVRGVWCDETLRDRLRADARTLVRAYAVPEMSAMLAAALTRMAEILDQTEGGGR